MAVSRINNNSDYYRQLSSMKKVDRAADNAAGLAIAEKLLSQINGYEMGTYNAQVSSDMLRVADGGLGQIQDSLQQIRDLSLQASNDILTAQDRATIQTQIDGLKGSIQDAAKGTEFNTLKLLDGSMADMNLATNPNGGGMKIELVNSTLESLGIENYDVTGAFNLSDIDNAISKVSEGRSSLGAVSNVLDHVISGNNITSENLSNARGRIVDLDAAKAVSDLQKQKVLNDYRQFAMMDKVKNDQNNIPKLLGL